MTRTEISLSILTLVLARLQAEGRAIDQIPADELKTITRDAAETLKLAMDITGTLEDE